MKKLNSFISLLLSVVLCFSATTVLANNINENNDGQTYVIKEEDMISQLQAMTDEELKSYGYQDNEIKEIRDFNYFEALSERAAMDDKTLLLYGYTEDEILELRDYVASGGRLRKTISSNTLTLSLSFSNIVAGKQGLGTVRWNWKRVALIKYTDCIAVAWKTTSGATLNYAPSSSYRMTTVWTKINVNASGAQTINLYDNWKVNSNESIYVRVGIGSDDYFAYSGVGQFMMKATSGNFSEFYIDIGYGHYYLLVTPTISVNVLTGSISISFNGAGQKDERHLKRVYNSRFGVVYNYDD